MGYDGLGGRTKFIQPVSFPAAHMVVAMLVGNLLCVSAILGSPAHSCQQKNGLRPSRTHQISLYLTLNKFELSKDIKDLNLQRTLSVVAHSEKHSDWK